MDVIERDPSRFAPPVIVDAPAEAAVTTIKPEPVPMAEVVKPPPKTESTDRSECQEYTVKFGDTLSEISERFLGSQNRYREIYEMNKDRMSSPDRLRVGRAIRVPRVIR